MVLYFYNYAQSFFQTSGPSLPIALHGHSMVKLGKGQAILGGRSNDVYQSKIYLMTCISKNCIISLLDRELSVQNHRFVAISIPDTISGCISGGENYSYKKQSKGSIPKLWIRKVRASICRLKKELSWRLGTLHFFLEYNFFVSQDKKLKV